MRILSIGNSFSQDAHRYLAPLAAAGGCSIEAINLYIGGCSLEQHWNNWEHDRPAYDYEQNGVCLRKSSIRQALESGAFDVVTFQQASPLSGIAQSFDPYLRRLSEAVRQRTDARFFLHETWAYEVDSPQEAFASYRRDQQEMYRRIDDAYRSLSGRLHMPLIPTGRVIQMLRSLPMFRYPDGGVSLCRDGFHLSLDYGRYAAAATWLQALAPGHLERNIWDGGLNPDWLGEIRRVVMACCSQSL